MTKNNRHITRKVFIGYLLMIAAAIYSLVYIYHLMSDFTEIESTNHSSQHKVYLVSNTLSYLYESEALGELTGLNSNDFRHINRALNKAQANIDTLYSLLPDSIQQLKLDTISRLLEYKRANMIQLLKIITEANTGHIYSQTIEKVISRQDSITVEKIEKEEEKMEIRQDTVIMPKAPKGFFKRLAEAFSPSKADTGVVINSTRKIINLPERQHSYNAADTIITVLKNLQDSVAGQQKQLKEQLLSRASALRYNNRIITQQINQLLRNVEQEELETSTQKNINRQHTLHKANQLIAGVAAVSVVIALLFGFFIWRDVVRSQYYRKQLETARQYAEELLQSREKLMLTISHDIRAPLSSIIGYIELLLRRKPGEREQYFLKNMNGSAEHILSLVNDLLDFHRLESNQMEIQQIPFDAGSLFESVATSFRPIAENKGLDFYANIFPFPTQFIGDPIRIRQITSNLLSNAIKFTPTGKIELKAYAKKAEIGYNLYIRVLDEGPGIPQEMQEKIFGEFTRLSGSEQEEGFGLGLSITKRLTERMEGKITLDSSDNGSIFLVELPLAFMPNPNQKNSSIEMPSVFENQSACRCLLVDDDPLQLAMAEELLRQNGIEIKTCNTPRNIIEVLENQTFDLVITDIQMPGFNGFELLAEIRKSPHPSIHQIPVIALSASAANEQEHYLEAGFNDFLTKPFTAAQLLQVMSRLLARELAPQKELDLSSLTAFAGDDPQASLSILQTFCVETRKHLLQLAAAQQSGNREETARVAHKLIPLFTMLSLPELTAKLTILEQNAPTLQKDTWSLTLGKVISEILPIIESVEQKLGNNSTMGK